MLRSSLCLSAISLLASSAAAQFSYTGFGPSSWGAPDSTLGLTEAYSIEDFEDTQLLPNLLIGVTSAAGSRPLSNTIPSVFNNSMDPNGSAFANGTWDGKFGLISTRDNASHNYFDASQVGVTTFQIIGGSWVFGFSFQQADANADLYLNGEKVGTISALFGLPVNGDRSGYALIKATGEALITDVAIHNNGNGDGFMFDHVAVVPAPGAATLLTLGALAATRRRR